MWSVHIHPAHALPIRRVVRLRVRRAWRWKAVLVRSMRRWMVAISRARGIGMGSVVVRSCAGRIVMVSRRLHRRIIGRPCRFEAGSRPVSRVWGTAVLLRPLFHLAHVLLLVDSMWSWLTRLRSSHGHVPTLPLAEFPLTQFSLANLHLPLMTFTLLSLSFRHVPLLFIFHHPDGALRVVFL